MSEYPLTGEKHPHRFQSHWFKSYPWLEYSEKNTAFCFPCYLSGKPGSDTFTVKGFNCWKKVNDGERCAFLTHIEKGPNSAHRFATRCLENLKNQLCHIEKVVKRQITQEILNNRLRIKTSIDIVRWLTLQACAFKGHDERIESKNRGNFLEMIELLASYNE
jgi:hypothetical protein